jgi:Uma2 family endonuclease
MATPTKLWTWEDALALPDGERYEVINGELKERCMSFGSSALAVLIIDLLRQWVRKGHPGTVTASDGGYTIFPWAPGDVRMPDVSFISSARLPRIPERGWVSVPPELAVEVVSPNDLASDIDEKARDYIRAGVDLVWVVYPRTRSVLVYRPDAAPTMFGAGETLSGGETLPDLELSVSELFPAEPSV